MESNLASESANQGANGVATVAEYVYARGETVGSNTIAVSTPYSSLSAVSQLFLGAQAKRR
jgi:hypothetical protein